MMLYQLQVVQQLLNTVIYAHRDQVSLCTLLCSVTAIQYMTIMLHSMVEFTTHNQLQ